MGWWERWGWNGVGGGIGWVGVVGTLVYREFLIHAVTPSRRGSGPLGKRRDISPDHPGEGYL